MYWKPGIGNSGDSCDTTSSEPTRLRRNEEVRVSRDSFIELIYEEHVVVGTLLFYTLQVTTNDIKM